jgi:queuine tRNA-ribosyltransferase/7-cyano-7-deazaguanine tRNA-ribosyltransferase
MELQRKIGADIIFAFDECTSPLNSYKYTKEALERTHEWLKRCIRQIQKSKLKTQNFNSKIKSKKNLRQTPQSLQQALFAIVQGGYFEDLRKKSAKFVAKQPVPGFGIGGSLGKFKQDVYDVLNWVIPLLPEDKPRHFLGIGQVRDIFESVELGVDTFDCVIPTREARHRMLYTKKGRINIKKMKTVDEVADKNCKCIACKSNVTMKQFNNLFSLKDPRAFFFATVHNIQFYADLMREIRESIEINKFSVLKEKYLSVYK